MTKLPEILELLKDLTPEERKRLRHELSKPYKQDSYAKEPDWLLEGMINECYHRGLWSKDLVFDPPKAYVEQAEVIKADLLVRVGKNISYRDKLKLGQTMAQCLIYYLGKEAPISLKYLCNSVGHVLPAVERSFPGYMRADLLKHVIRKG